MSDDGSPPVNSTSLAVLIDADNTPPKIVDGLFEEIAKFGTASVKRIYGDWTQGASGKLLACSGFQSGPQSRRTFEGMLVACREIATTSVGQTGSPEGHDLKRTSDAPCL